MKLSLWGISMITLLSGIPFGGALACSDCEVDDQAPLEYRGGTTVDGTYETTNWNEEWLHFPQGRTYKLFHALGTDRYTVHLYLGFQPAPLEQDGSAESAGNIGIIEKATDRYVQIRNDTCAEMYVRAVAVAASDAGAAGAGP